MSSRSFLVHFAKKVFAGFICHSCHCQPVPIWSARLLYTSSHVASKYDGSYVSRGPLGALQMTSTTYWNLIHHLEISQQLGARQSRFNIFEGKSLALISWLETEDHCKIAFLLLRIFQSRNYSFWPPQCVFFSFSLLQGFIQILLIILFNYLKSDEIVLMLNDNKLNGYKHLHNKSICREGACRTRQLWVYISRQLVHSLNLPFSENIQDLKKSSCLHFYFPLFALSLKYWS